MAARLVDSHNRWIHKLRVQLTDACNFRCFYCMPKDAKFLPPNELLSADEIVALCSALVDLGVDEIRVTGGEPTIRREFPEIIERLSDLSVSKLGLTTNGYVLSRHLEFLRTTRLRHINISLDSLQAEKFNHITRTQKFDKVMESILRARDSGFTVKLNMILFRGINSDEVPDFVAFSENQGIEVRFLEYMNIGPQYKETQGMFISAGEIIASLEKCTSLESVRMPHDSTSFNFVTPKGGRIGFIASESKPFCGACSRLRLSATGKLRACLMSENGIELRGVPVERYPEILQSVMRMKPTGRIHDIAQPMHQIGG